MPSASSASATSRPKACATRPASSSRSWRSAWRRSAFDLYPALADEIVARGAAPAGLTWHFARPPVQGLDFEMDVRGVAIERVI
jgi:hypothetical protein